MKSRSRCLNETRKMEKGEATNMTCDIMEKCGGLNILQRWDGVGSQWD